VRVGIRKPVSVSTRAYSSGQPRVARNFINGQWENSKTDKYIDLVQPSTNKVIVRVPESTNAEMKAATKAAQTAFESWQNVPLPQIVRTMLSTESASTRISIRSPRALLKSWVRLRPMLEEMY